MDLCTFRAELVGMPALGVEMADPACVPGAAREPAVPLNQPGLKMGGEAACAGGRPDSNAVTLTPRNNRWCRGTAVSADAPVHVRRADKKGFPNGFTAALPRREPEIGKQRFEQATSLGKWKPIQRAFNTRVP